MNIIQHAYGGDCRGEVILEISGNREELIFRLKDFAKPVDRRVIKPRHARNIRPGGLGLYLIREVMDEMTFLDPPKGIGNILEMKKRIFPWRERDKWNAR